VINTFSQIDYLASSGRSPWHRASAFPKLLLTGWFVAIAVATPSWGVLVMLLVAALALCVTARVPLKLVFAAATTPILFSFIFVFAHARADWDEPLLVAALALCVTARVREHEDEREQDRRGRRREHQLERHARADWDEPLILFARPMVASLTAVWLVASTPYPDLFAPLSRILPRAVGDSLFLTYRAVFALMDQVERMWKALRLRGAMARPVRQRFAVMGEAVGTVVLAGFDRSHRLYQAMRLRGHSGRICGCRHYLDFTPADLWVAIVAVLVTIASVLLWGLRNT
jgi:energy-coupling factor transporter transmembrane protein EcfT